MAAQAGDPRARAACTAGGGRPMPSRFRAGEGAASPSGSLANAAFAAGRRARGRAGQGRGSRERRAPGRGTSPKGGRPVPLTGGSVPSA